MPLRIQKRKITDEVKQHALNLMKEVGIDHVAYHYPNQMSGGDNNVQRLLERLSGNQF